MGTRREQMTEYLRAYPRTAKQLAGLMKMRARDVVDDLEHVRSSMGRAFVVEAARCSSCDFEFDSKKLSTPSRCPKCRSERVNGPWLSIESG